MCIGQTCSRLYSVFSPSYCSSNVFWTFLLNQTVFYSRQTLIRICAFLLTACRRGICPAMAIGGSGMRLSLSKDSCYEEGDSWRNFHTIPIQAKLPSEQRLTFIHMKRDLGQYMFFYPCHLIG